MSAGPFCGFSAECHIAKTRLVKHSRSVVDWAAVSGPNPANAWLALGEIEAWLTTCAWPPSPTWPQAIIVRADLPERPHPRLQTVILAYGIWSAPLVAALRTLPGSDAVGLPLLRDSIALCGGDDGLADAEFVKATVTADVVISGP